MYHSEIMQDSTGGIQNCQIMHDSRYIYIYIVYIKEIIYGRTYVTFSFGTSQGSCNPC